MKMRKTQNYLRDRIVAALGEEGVKLLIQDLKRKSEGYNPQWAKGGRPGISGKKLHQLHEMQKLHPTWGSHRLEKLLGIGHMTILKYGKKCVMSRKWSDEQIEVLRRYREEHPEASMRAISREFGIATPTIKRYLNI